MNNRKQFLRNVHSIKILLFGLTMMLFCVIGLLWFARPDTSEVEKRRLTEFPSLTAAGIWDGSFFSEIETWYADTFPGRETLIQASQSLQSHYGIRSTQIVGDTAIVADAIPEAPQEPILAPVEETQPEAMEEPEEESEPYVWEEEDEDLADGTIRQSGEVRGNIYITNNSAFNLYYFNQSGADAFAGYVNRFYENVKDKVNVYVLAAPLNAGIMLDESVLEDMGCSDEGAALDYIYGSMEEGIHKLNTYETLKKHNAEYLYFHTDHHWTQLGAYYAYRVFCREKGIRPHELEEFEMKTFDNFLGTFYSSSNQSQELYYNPDTVYAYVPNGTNSMWMKMEDGSSLDWYIINDVSDYSSSNKYAAFVGGDRPFSMCHNPEITDGSAVCVIKDSYGNAFIPWLVDHYEYVYWLDVRYTYNTISQMVDEYGVQDVIIVCHLYNAQDKGGSFERLLEIGQ